ncbi:HlyD family type I secretion periplasmic adaptor subunit [Bradyrhizobium sp. BR13661]|jgi:hemolysin D|uniref:HlyD family type I secretion periplasmic adaptor subunit n=1 Tax=Bradyrhizobium sp. BR13661 TaxID=2940622 RepID=UPI0024730733|nr:HlyD family type I secretion periplasmic adaptor subunit [Bradyrhizobium sp. BR13661]MDH6264386.1 hemolysin D [Bradyrhizobium sp. BR13661]
MRLVKFIKPYVLQLIAYLKKHYEIQKPRVIAGLRFLWQEITELRKDPQKRAELRDCIHAFAKLAYTNAQDLKKWEELNNRILGKIRELPHSHLLTGQTDEHEFLPAALEIVETPPSPASRLIAGSIIAFLLIALLWSIFGSVDIIATATGKIVPTGRTKIIQPLESGVVHAIHVQDGQHVKEGDVLIEIDTTVSAAERDRLQSDHMQAMLDVARLKAALNLDGDPVASFMPPEGATPTQIDLQKSYLTNQVDEIRAKLSGLDHQIKQHEGDRDSVAATIAKLNQSIPYLEKRAEAREALAKKGYGSKLESLTTQQDLVEHQQELKVQQGKLDEAEGALAALKEQRLQAEDEYKHTNLKDLSEAEQKEASLGAQLTQAAQKYRLQTLTAPVDGTVQQLAVHTEGGVVTPAQVLMSVVPADSHMEVEAMISNRDIGFVREGQEAEIKIDTFNFTKYGLVHGVVQSVSHDSIQREKPADKSESQRHTGDESDTSEPTGQELVYSARIALDQTEMDIDDHMVPLEPGMAVTAEIKTGSRHIIEYLLSPLLRHKQMALRER